MLVVSHDCDLAGRLRAILETDHRRSVEIASSYRDAARIVVRRLPQAIILDLRPSDCGENPVALLKRLSEDGQQRVPVIAVSDSGYVCRWAGVADMVIAGRLSLPLDRRQLASLLDTEIAHQLFKAAPGLMTPRIVRGRDVSIKTYTPQMSDLMDNLQTIAPHNVTVLLVGETGTGKTTMAKLIHELSPRADSRLLTVACGALPPELIESELFGHVRGAFTSADQSRIGKFEAAKSGTLLLDEIDVIEPSQQAKLLRVIETGEFEPVGSNETRRLKARLIVASNVDLKQLLDRNEFRADLYYRLNTLEFRIPPLRERPRDIVPLTLDFVDDFCKAHAVDIRRIDPDFLACLKVYAWPGNVRELKNHIRRAVLFCRSQTLAPDDLAPHLRQTLADATVAKQSSPEVDAPPTNLSERVAQSEREILEQALAANNQNRTATARALGMSRVGLYKKLKKYGMVTPKNPPDISAN